MSDFDTAVGGPHDGVSVVTRGPTLERAAGAVVLLHGQRATPHGALAVTESFDTDSVAFLAPGAADGRWFPGEIAAQSPTEPAVTSGLALVGRLVERAGRAVGRDRVALLGFSQGGCLAAEWAVRNPDRYGGVIVLAGGLLETDDRSPAGSLAPDGDATPVLLCGSRADPAVSVERLQATRAVFESLDGAVETLIAETAGHAVTPEQLAATRGILRTLGT